MLARSASPVRWRWHWRLMGYAGPEQLARTPMGAGRRLRDREGERSAMPILTAEVRRLRLRSFRDAGRELHGGSPVAKLLLR